LTYLAKQQTSEKVLEKPKPKMNNSTILEKSASINPGFSAQNNSALLNFIELFNQNTQPPKQEFIFESGEEYLLITFYILILLLGLIFNAAIIWVILARPNNRNPRNMYTVNLAFSGILVGVFCVPTTMDTILYGGWWHFGFFACKLVPAIQGANILVSAFTITVIAIDRWISVTNTNPAESLTYNRVIFVIGSTWTMSFALMTPLFIFQELKPVVMADHVIGKLCSENFPRTSLLPDQFWSYSFTFMILMVQYFLPLSLLPIVYTKILVFLRRNSGLSMDTRRKEREMKRNKRMTATLSGISVIFAVSWLPYHAYLILTDIFILGDQTTSEYYLTLGICHCIAMTSIFTNPLMYGWFNTSLRSELETLLPKCCREWLHRDGGRNVQNGVSSSRPLQNGQNGPPSVESPLAIEMAKGPFINYVINFPIFYSN